MGHSLITLREVKIFTLLIILLINSACVWAISGGQPGNIFSYGSDARSFAMGRTYATLSDDAASVYRNPACMMDVKQMSGLFMQASLPAHSYSVMSFVYPGLYESYGGSMITLANSLAGDKRDANNVSLGSFVDKQDAMAFAYAKRLNHNFSYGGAFKMYSRQLDDSKDSFMVFDLGVNYTLFDNLTLGGVFNNVYSMNNAQAMTSDTIPLVWRGGIAYKTDDYCFAFDITDSFNQWYLGAEYKLMNMFFLRGGINYEELTFGVGVEYSLLRFDIALGKQDTVGDTMKFSCVVNFGEDKKDQVNREVKRLILEAADYNDNGFYNLARQSYASIEVFSPLDKEVLVQIEKLNMVIKLQNTSLQTERSAWESLKRAREYMKSSNLSAALKEAKDAEKIMPYNTRLGDLVKLLKTAVGSRE